MMHDIDEVRREVAATVYTHWQFFLAEGLLMVVLGMLAIGLPDVASLAITLLLGWLFLVGGILRVVSVLASRRRPGFMWSLLSPVCAAVLGFLLVFDPIGGVLTVTLLLGAYFVVDGVVKIMLAFELRQHLESWGWTLFSGVVDLLLAFLIWSGWPGSAAWAIGLLVGVNMCLVGLSLTMLALAARRPAR
ncbi:MAG TPA: HdeD family acid-resistance protein [Stellaceae bacterium]|nr:HdeD family acid-resistance protein [Stellaceae bacterium]